MTFNLILLTDPEAEVAIKENLKTDFKTTLCSGPRIDPYRYFKMYSYKYSNMFFKFNSVLLVSDMTTVESIKIP